MLLELFVWWYGSGWLSAWRRIGEWTGGVEKAFSLGVLVSTLFAPWRQIVALPGRSVDEKLRASIDNLVSRTIGFFVRSGVLFVALILLLLTALIGLVIAIAWPLIPLAFIYSIYRGIAG